MCGICGKVWRDPLRPADRALVETMSGCLAHRGPDAGEVWVRGNAALAHRRLSVIDLAGGTQPMANEDGSIWIAFNGEIYNFRALREELVARGHAFRTRSDTEVILHLYEDRGERCVEVLRGMFAFAIWDARRQELLLARDRIGKKPLYYAETADGLTFASEMKSLLADPAVEREVDLDTLDQFLTLQYVPSDRAIFKSIGKLPPAHTLRWKDGACSLRRYWQLNYEPKLAIGEEEACERVRAEIDEAVHLRLESDVPLGCLLSGGIDSSAVVAYTRRHLTGELRTFSIGFEEETHNELPYARRIADLFGTTHEEWIVRPQAVDLLPRLVWYFDEPFADSSALPTWFVAEMTRRRVTVALTGDGGDESFAGYERYRGVPLIERYGHLPRWLRRGALEPLARVAAHAMPGVPAVDRFKELNRVSFLPPSGQYAQYMVIFRESNKRRVFGPMMNGCAQRENLGLLAAAYDRPGVADAVERKMFTDIATYLPGDLLVKMDRMTMAHGLEARSPFLDHKLMELAASLPAEMKMRDGCLKSLLKKALAPILPAEILHRRKQGFGVPLEAWFKNDLPVLIRETLLSRRALDRGFFQPAGVRELIDQHVSGRRNHQHRLWTLLVFELWCQTYLDRPQPWLGPIGV